MYMNVNKLILDGVEEIDEYGLSYISFSSKNEDEYTEIDYGASLKRICVKAFYYSIIRNFPESIESIESSAFGFAKIHISGNILQMPKNIKDVSDNFLEETEILNENTSITPRISFAGCNIIDYGNGVFERVKYKVIINDGVENINMYLDVIENLQRENEFIYSPDKKHLLHYEPQGDPGLKTFTFPDVTSVASRCFNNIQHPNVSLEFPNLANIYHDAFSRAKFYKVVVKNVRKLSEGAFERGKFQYMTLISDRIDTIGSGALSYVDIGIPDFQFPMEVLERTGERDVRISILGFDGYFEKPLVLQDFNHSLTISSKKEQKGGFTTTCIVSGDMTRFAMYRVWCHDIIFDKTVKKANYKALQIWQPSNKLRSVTFEAVEDLDDYSREQVSNPQKYVFPATLKKFPSRLIMSDFVENNGEIVLPDSLPFKLDGNMVISKDGKTVYSFILKEGEQLQIPESVTTLDAYSLQCINEGKVTIPGTVKNVIDVFNLEAHIDLVLEDGVKVFKQTDENRFTSVTFPKNIEDVVMRFGNLYAEKKLHIPEGCKAFEVSGNILYTANKTCSVGILEEVPESLEFDCERVDFEYKLDWDKLKKVTFTNRLKYLTGYQLKNVKCQMEIPQLNFYSNDLEFCRNLIGNVTVSVEQDPNKVLIESLPVGFNIILNVEDEPAWAFGKRLYSLRDVYAPIEYKKDTFMGMNVIRENRTIVYPTPETEEGSSTGQEGGGNDSNSGTLGGGAIAGIVISVIVAIVVIGALLFFFVFKKKGENDIKEDSDSSEENEV